MNHKDINPAPKTSESRHADVDYKPFVGGAFNVVNNKKYKDVYGEYLGTCERALKNRDRLELIKNEYQGSAIINGKFPPPHINKIVFTYLMFDGKYYKIGQSSNVKKRFLTMRVANPNLKIICFGRGRTEKNLHDEYESKKIRGEWFDLNAKNVLDLIFKITGKTITKEDAIKESFIDLNKKNKRVFLHFGKYKGCDVYKMTGEEEIRYLKWLSEQDWLSEYYQNAIINHFDNIESDSNKNIIQIL